MDIFALHFIFKGKSLIDFANLLSPNIFKKNYQIKFELFLNVQLHYKMEEKFPVKSNK